MAGFCYNAGMQHIELPIICLMGPTASGKTALAIELVQRYNCEIISVDSALIYRGMDIGTAKPTADEQALAPHRLIDICDPSESYSVGRFCQDVMREITDIQRQGRIPLLVGGTMMYFNALQKGLAEIPAANPAARQQIADEATELGWPALHAKLLAIDPTVARNIHANDSQRIQRALEVYYSSGKRLSEFQSRTKPFLDMDSVINIALVPEQRSELHQRIAQRFDKMLEQGFLAEVQRLRDRGDLHLNMPAIRTVGYRQAWRYFDGDYDSETMREKSIIATRQLAKRQITWLRSWPEVTIFNGQSRAIFTHLENLIQL